MVSSARGRQHSSPPAAITHQDLRQRSAHFTCLSVASSESEDRAFCQVLHRDDGRLLGYVVRYYEDGPTYAWTMARRIGGCSTDQAARSVAEQALAEGR